MIIEGFYHRTDANRLTDVYSIDSRGSRPRLEGRRHSPRAGHRLAMLAGACISLRRSPPYVYAIWHVLWSHHEKTTRLGGFFVVTPGGVEPPLQA